jgi:hypothetical protein
MKGTISFRIVVLATVISFIAGAILTPPVLASGAATSTARISFAKGTTSATVSGNLAAYGTMRYAIYAGVNQLMDVTLSAPQGASIKVTTTGGVALTPISGTSGSTGFRGYLPYTGNYYITVFAGSQAVSYSLNVFIPVRIRFAAGTTSKSLTAHLNAYQGLDYIAWARVGQILQINATPSTSGAPLQLIIYGVDGTVLRSGMGEGSSFIGQLPFSEDYIISVRAAETATDFTLQVIIPQVIRFASGSYSGTVYTYLPTNGTQYYSLSAAQNQAMQVVVSPATGLKLAIRGMDGTVLKSANSGGASFSGTLPSTQVYLLAVTNTGYPIQYKMTVTIQ